MILIGLSVVVGTTLINLLTYSFFIREAWQKFVYMGIFPSFVVYYAFLVVYGILIIGYLMWIMTKHQQKKPANLMILGVQVVQLVLGYHILASSPDTYLHQTPFTFLLILGLLGACMLILGSTISSKRQ